MSKRKRIDVYILNRSAPSARLRWANYRDHFAENGMELSIKEYIEHVFKRSKVKKKIEPADVIVIQKTVLAPRVVRAFRKQAPKLILDVDDAIWLSHSSIEAEQPTAKERIFRRWFVKSLDYFDRVIVGNDYLKNWVERYNSNISIVPCSPCDKWTGNTAYKEHEKKDKFILGWTGTRQNLFYLNSIEHALKAFFDRAPNAYLMVISDGVFETPDPMVNSRIINVPWSIENEQSYLIAFDVGLMPLTDDPWSRGKGAFKTLMYFRYSVPSVSSRIGFNTEVVTDGVNGLLAQDTQEWFEKLMLLYGDPELARRIGVNGHQTYLKYYSQDVVFAKYLEAMSL